MRKYGMPPYRVAVVHGGPGAAGEMAPVARELAAKRGVLEPLQTADSVDGQIGELSALLGEHAAVPVALIGHSWGAWLSLMVSAASPSLTRKLILVGSGPLEQTYADSTTANRMRRLGEKERAAYRTLIDALTDPDAENKDALLAQLGALASNADTYEQEAADAGTPHVSPAINHQAHIYQNVWMEGAELRRSGKLLQLAHDIRCPVVAIHGAHDPHPAEGVRAPLAAGTRDFRFILLEKCGHKPWIEKHARKQFYRILDEELTGL